MNPDDKVYVAGHCGMVGSAIVRRLRASGFQNIVTRSRVELDLTRQQDVEDFFQNERPSYVFVAAAKVGGILANSTYPADFVYANLAIETNVLHAAWKSGVEKLLLLGSSCIYPRLAPQPITEDSFLTGPLEPTNEAYAVAKIAGIVMAQSYWRQYGARFISAMPTNLYGPGDNFNLETSHVVPALMRKLDTAARQGDPEVSIWGTGTVRREFLHVDDLAHASLHLMQTYESPEIINVGTGTDLTIRELAELIGDVVGFTGTFRFDTTKPDGTPRKLLDVSRLTALHWRPSTALRDGLAATYAWYKAQG